uniref:Cytochrome c oxidase assembly factor 3 mitochondrial coiled-coil domain-containing protein n=1 Tax=Tetranychus urticae TaxID=32264 RepID=T1K8J9_TETUR
MMQRKRARIAGAVLSLITVGIYGYTIHAIKQEKLFDDDDDTKS